MIQNEDILEQNGDDAEMSDITYKPGYNKLDSFNWLSRVEEFDLNREIVEVRFKNTRKGFYRNTNDLKLEIGDVVAVEASPGHDIGRVSMIGRLAAYRFKDSKCMVPLLEMKKIYRIARAVDIQKWEEAKKLEEKTMLRSRKIAEDLKLDMKIGDVEYQGDKTKAIFYYIADESGFPPAYQGFGRGVSHKSGDETDRSSSGGRKNWRYRLLWKGVMLFNTYNKLYFRDNHTRQISGTVA